jgi:hypothetical protein
VGDLGVLFTFMPGIDRETLPRISDGGYLHLVRDQSSTKKMTVKEKEFLDPTRFLGSGSLPASICWTQLEMFECKEDL